MRTLGKVGLTLVTVLFLLQGAAEARTIQGQVVRTDTNAGLLVVREVGPELSEPMELEIPVLPETQLVGFQTLEDLKADDEVSVETEEGAEGGVIKALSIERIESEPAVELE